MMTIAVHMIAVGYFARHSEAYAVAESGVSAVSKKLQHIANTRTDTHKHPAQYNIKIPLEERFHRCKPL